MFFQASVRSSEPSWFEQALTERKRKVVHFLKQQKGKTFQVNGDLVPAMSLLRGLFLEDFMRIRSEARTGLVLSVSAASELIDRGVCFLNRGKTDGGVLLVSASEHITRVALCDLFREGDEGAGCASWSKDLLCHPVIGRQVSALDSNQSNGDAFQHLVAAWLVATANRDLRGSQPCTKCPLFAALAREHPKLQLERYGLAASYVVDERNYVQDSESFVHFMQHPSRHRHEMFFAPKTAGCDLALWLCRLPSQPDAGGVADDVQDSCLPSFLPVMIQFKWLPRSGMVPAEWSKAVRTCQPEFQYCHKLDQETSFTAPSDGCKTKKWSESWEPYLLNKESKWIDRCISLLVVGAHDSHQMKVDLSGCAGPPRLTKIVRLSPSCNDLGLPECLLQRLRLKFEVPITRDSNLRVLPGVGPVRAGAAESVGQLADLAERPRGFPVPAFQQARQLGKLG